MTTPEHSATVSPVQSGPSPSSPARLLILTLYCGEPQYAQQCKALEEQTFTSFDHWVLAYLPNAEAHRTLYSQIMENRDNYDYFLKLDADMVPSRPTALDEMLAFAMNRPEVDHIQFRMWDFFTDRLMPALHLFSKRVSWQLQNESLFVDPKPKVIGERIKHNRAPVPFIDHSPDPSPQQCFEFGVHRGLKAFQPGRNKKEFDAIRFQLNVLFDTYKCWVRHGDRRHLLVIAGADLVARGLIDPDDSYKHGNYSQARFKELEAKSNADITGTLSPFWATPQRRRLRLWREIGLKGLGHRQRKKIRKAIRRTKLNILKITEDT